MSKKSSIEEIYPGDLDLQLYLTVLEKYRPTQQTLSGYGYELQKEARCGWLWVNWGEVCAQKRLQAR
jgi:hypothetical protein